jgi:5-formyltetrahydrofolate cyclo-ligase
VNALWSKTKRRRSASPEEPLQAERRVKVSRALKTLAQHRDCKQENAYVDHAQEPPRTPFLTAAAITVVFVERVIFNDVSDESVLEILQVFHDAGCVDTPSALPWAYGTTVA